ncbi:MULTISPECIES: hypothetical protein [Anoxynatronum]|uniref:Uncharacterized protein n=2 Tax=Anoxynatronum TaxID=210622 RepID=A0AA45WW76_9CLOT|nr:hypothetical protein [Anoxynatronum buryatiense]SMP58036.1 hypothetical protein SAMN06296020_10732 [Anoxynatronum buryatiense]
MSVKIFLQTATKEQIQQLEQCKSKEALIAMIDSLGITLTPEETQILEETFKGEAIGELDEADLEQVAGGSRMQVPSSKQFVGNFTDVSRLC